MDNKYSSIRLEITSKCNLNCAYCHNKYYNNKENDMSYDDIIKLVDNIRKKYNIKKILLTGGEPTFNPKVYDYIREFTDRNIKVDMVTNGTLLNEKNIKKMDEAGLKRIRISIDEVGDTTFNRDRIIPNFIWKQAALVKKHSNIQLCIHTVCSPTNVDNLFDIYLKVLETGARRWRVFDMGFQGGVIDNKDKFNFNDYYMRLIKSTNKILNHYLKNNIKDVLDIEINNIFKTSFLDLEPDKNFNIKDFYDNKINRSPCSYVTEHQITIRSDGKATLCQYFHDTIFDFKKYDYDAEEAVKNKNKCIENEISLKDLNYCSKCKYVMNCSSGCRASAKYLTNDVLDADPKACYLHPLVYQYVIKALPKNVVKTYEQYLLDDGLEPKYSKDDLERFLKEKGFKNE